MTSPLPFLLTGLLVLSSLPGSPAFATDTPLRHPRLMADSVDILRARTWLTDHRWYRTIVEERRAEIDHFLARRPIFVSPIKQTYHYKMYTCPNHDVELLYEEERPSSHRCPRDSTESIRGARYDAAWAGWYNRRIATSLVWLGILYQLTGEERYADAGHEILMQFADLYLRYPTENTILGPAHVFFGTLSESFWGVDMAYGYDFLYESRAFSPEDHRRLKEQLFLPLARITQLFPESASNRQLWYNNVSAAVGFLYGDRELIDFALHGKFGFTWQLGSALPESGFWPEWSGYHFVALRGMIHLAEMARHNGMDLYRMRIAGRTLKSMFDAPFDAILPNYEFPRIKDSGGGNLLEYAPFYEIGYAVYGDPRYAALLNLTYLRRGSQVVAEESGLGGARSPITMFHLVPVVPPDTMNILPAQSTNLEGNGFALLRNAGHALYLDYGIMGGEHGHPDRLQIGYFARGRNWIVDPLNEMYFNPNLQLWFRQTIAHPTLVVDQTSQTWTNGRGRFFGALPGMQVASGECSTSYPGTALTRTVLQVDEYFIDLFDAAGPDVRILDWPLHAEGTLTLSGVRLEREPRDLFGHQPWLPGYDQLTEISSGTTDSAWRAEFTSESGERLSIHGLAEPGSRLYSASAPPLGGFYKQMVGDQRPRPMIIHRRITDSTRFAHLVTAHPGSSTVRSFDRGTGSGTYRVRHAAGEDDVVADVAHSRFSLLRSFRGSPVRIDAFNASRVNDALGRTLLLSPVPLRAIECRFEGSHLFVDLPGDFATLRIYAPGIAGVTLNGRTSLFRRDSSTIVLENTVHPVLESLLPDDSTVYAGKTNLLRLSVWNPHATALTGTLRLTPAADWKERVQSQLDWWGGIVNLLPLHKSSVERRTSPHPDLHDGRWLSVAAGKPVGIPPGERANIELLVPVPADIPAADYPVVLRFGPCSLKTTLRVEAPVSASLLLPNGKRETLRIRLANAMPVPQDVTTELSPSPEWEGGGIRRQTVRLAPRETRSLDIPCRLTGYRAEAQRYPVRVRISSGEYSAETERDFFVAIARNAVRPPSLDGSWRGWDRSAPLAIDSSSQIAKLLLGNQPWKGPSDFSSRVYAMYDAHYLYIGADVTDDVRVTTWDFPAMSYPWDTDCMEVVLDTRMNTAQGTDPPTPGVYRHLCMAEYRRTEFGPEKWQGGGAGGPLLPKPLLFPDAETYFHPTPTGYAMICRFPLRNFPRTLVEPGEKIGFDIAFSDNDGTTYRKNQHIWAGFTRNQSWWDMGTIGALIFGPRR